MTILNLGGLLDDLERILTTLLDSPGGRISVHRESARDAPLRVTTNISVRVGLLDSAREEARPQLQREPFIDIVDSDEGPRVLVMLPGIRKEDVRCTLRDGRMEIQIDKGDTVFKKEINCAAKPSAVRVRSIVENNSVIEIRFAKERRRNPH